MKHALYVTFRENFTINFTQFQTIVKKLESIVNRLLTYVSNSEMTTPLTKCGLFNDPAISAFEYALIMWIRSSQKTASSTSDQKSKLSALANLVRDFKPNARASNTTHQTLPHSFTINFSFRQKLFMLKEVSKSLNFSHSCQFFTLFFQMSNSRPI